MPRATLILDADTSALRRSLGEIPGITQRVQSVMTSQARRGGRERVGIDQTFAREHESIHMRLARAREKQAREVTRTTAAEARKQALAEAQSDRERERSAQALARAQERYERDTTPRTAARTRACRASWRDCRSWSRAAALAASSWDTRGQPPP